MYASGPPIRGDPLLELFRQKLLCGAIPEDTTMVSVTEGFKICKMDGSIRPKETWDSLGLVYLNFFKRIKPDDFFEPELLYLGNTTEMSKMLKFTSLHGNWQDDYFYLQTDSDDKEHVWVVRGRPLEIRKLGLSNYYRARRKRGLSSIDPPQVEDDGKEAPWPRIRYDNPDNYVRYPRVPNAFQINTMGYVTAQEDTRIRDVFRINGVIFKYQNNYSHIAYRHDEIPPLPVYYYDYRCVKHVGGWISAPTGCGKTAAMLMCAELPPPFYRPPESRSLIITTRKILEDQIKEEVADAVGETTATICTWKDVNDEVLNSAARIFIDEAHEMTKREHRIIRDVPYTVPIYYVSATPVDHPWENLSDSFFWPQKVNMHVDVTVVPVKLKPELSAFISRVAGKFHDYFHQTNSGSSPGTILRYLEKITTYGHVPFPEAALEIITNMINGSIDNNNLSELPANFHIYHEPECAVCMQDHQGDFAVFDCGHIMCLECSNFYRSQRCHNCRAPIYHRYAAPNAVHGPKKRKLGEMVVKRPDARKIEVYERHIHDFFERSKDEKLVVFVKDEDNGAAVKAITPDSVYVSSDDDAEELRRFKVDPQIRVLIMDMRICSGVDLRMASELWILGWNMSGIDAIQAVGRVTRFGMTKAKIIVFPYENSTEIMVWRHRHYPGIGYNIDTALRFCFYLQAGPLVTHMCHVAGGPFCCPPPQINNRVFYFRNPDIYFGPRANRKVRFYGN